MKSIIGMYCKNIFEDSVHALAPYSQSEALRDFF